MLKVYFRANIFFDIGNNIEKLSAHIVHMISLLLHIATIITNIATNTKSTLDSLHELTNGCL